MAKKAIFVMLLIWASQLCAEGTETAETNASNPKHEQQTILKSKVEAGPINNDPNKHKEESEGTPKNDTEDTCMIKTQRLYYTQLLEIHRSYFTVFLQVLSIYLAIVGACAKVVYDHVNKLHKNSSLFTIVSLMFFVILVSGFFLKGMASGKEDAHIRKTQIKRVEKRLSIESAVSIELLETNAYTRKNQIKSGKERQPIKSAVSVELLEQVIDTMTFAAWIFIVIGTITILGVLVGWYITGRNHSNHDESNNNTTPQ